MWAKNRSILAQDIDLNIFTIHTLDTKIPKNQESYVILNFVIKVNVPTIFTVISVNTLFPGHWLERPENLFICLICYLSVEINSFDQFVQRSLTWQKRIKFDILMSSIEEFNGFRRTVMERGVILKFMGSQRLSGNRITGEFHLISFRRYLAD